MRELRPPWEEQSYIAAMKEKHRASLLQKNEEEEETEQGKKKRLRDEELFRKAHPELYEEEEQAVGQMVMLNGEEIENAGKKREKRNARFYGALLWIKRWWIPALIGIILLYIFVPIPKSIHRTMDTVRLSPSSEEQDVLQIDGRLWKKTIFNDTFTLTVRTGKYETKIQGYLKTMNRIFDTKIMIIETDQEELPNDFIKEWIEISSYQPINAFVSGDFTTIILNSKGHRLLVGPARSKEEADKIIEELQIPLM